MVVACGVWIDWDSFVDEMGCKWVMVHEVKVVSNVDYFYWGRK